ncbi:MAG: hypothetical protein ACFFD1_01705, partial [Candidatus Thorarchaeota archaeon]
MTIINGKFTRFWGSLEHDVKIDYNFETFDYFLITFKNSNQLENSFEVDSLCKLAQLFMRTLEIDEKFGEKLAI